MYVHCLDVDFYRKTITEASGYPLKVKELKDGKIIGTDNKFIGDENYTLMTSEFSCNYIYLSKNKELCSDDFLAIKKHVSGELKACLFYDIHQLLNELDIIADTALEEFEMDKE